MILKRVTFAGKKITLCKFNRGSNVDVLFRRTYMYMECNTIQIKLSYVRVSTQRSSFCIGKNFKTVYNFLLKGISKKVSGRVVVMCLQTKAFNNDYDLQWLENPKR